MAATAFTDQWHTPPDKWAEPRVYQTPFDEAFAKRIEVGRCPMPAALPERSLSPNKAYWYATIAPDRTKPGPWNAEILIYNERDYLVRIRLTDIHYCREVEWVNEKLLRIRVWWGRICGTDLILDVEQERIICRETLWDGTIAFEQYQQGKKRESRQITPVNPAPPKR